MNYQEVEENLIKMALEGKFDVIAHGCNCFCTMGAGIAPQMARAFSADTFAKEADFYRGDINKLGQIDMGHTYIKGDDIKVYNRAVVKSWEQLGYHKLVVVNAYTQYGFGANHKGGMTKPVDYQAIAMVFKKMNHVFKGKHIGLPKIGCGLAGGNWGVVKSFIKMYMQDVDVTVIIFKP